MKKMLINKCGNLRKVVPEVEVLVAVEEDPKPQNKSYRTKKMLSHIKLLIVNF